MPTPACCCRVGSVAVVTESTLRYLDVDRALNDNPTITLFRQEKWGPIILATLMSVFDQGQREIPVDQFHTQVRRVFLAIQEEMSDFPLDPDDLRAVRDRCKSWVDRGWLGRFTVSDSEVYRLTAEAREAMRITRDLSSTRAAMSESQVRIILDRAQALALKATADPDARKERLGQQIERLESDLDRARTELERLDAGGAVELADADVILSDFLHLTGEIARLPEDLKRVEASFASMAREIVDDFLADERPHGVIVGEYLGRIHNLVEADPYGRGFAQAKALLGDRASREALRRNLELILTHPFAELLNDQDRAEARRIVRMIAAAVEGVYLQRRELTDRVSNFLRSNDASRERELAQALQAAQVALRDWVDRNPGGRARLTTPVGHVAFDVDANGLVLSGGQVGVAEVATLREQAQTLVVRTPLMPLRQSGGAGPTLLPVWAIRALGGPFYDDLSAAIDKALTRRARVPGDELFNSLPDVTRRPVDLLGLLNLATDTGGVELAGVPMLFHAVRPDGSTQTFEAPPMVFTAAPESDK